MLGERGRERNPTNCAAAPSCTGLLPSRPAERELDGKPRGSRPAVTEERGLVGMPRGSRPVVTGKRGLVGMPRGSRPVLEGAEGGPGLRCLATWPRLSRAFLVPSGFLGCRPPAGLAGGRRGPQSEPSLAAVYCLQPADHSALLGTWLELRAGRAPLRCLTLRNRCKNKWPIFTEAVQDSLRCSLLAPAPT